VRHHTSSTYTQLSDSGILLFLCGHEEKNQHEIKFSQKILMIWFSQLWMWKTG